VHAQPLRRMSVKRVAALGVGLACAPAEGDPRVETVRPLVVATDLDPRPEVVEVALEAAPGVVELVDGVPTSVLAYREPGTDAVVPGPLIEATVGDRLIVHFANALPGLDTTVHWHGLRLPAAMDGNPMVSGVVEPGAGFEYELVLRDAGLYWYHPHVDSDVQVELGLQGILLVRERETMAVDRERIFALDDVELAQDGSVVVDLSSEDAMLGRRGPDITINGGPPGRIVAAPGSVERWRFVSTANGRYFAVAAEGLSFRVIGWDGGFVDAYDTDVLRIAPGERYDVLVQVPSREGSIDVVTLAVDRGGGMTDDEAHLFELVVHGDARESEIVDPPVSIAPLDLGSGQTRRFELTSTLDGPGSPAFFINGQRWPLDTHVHVRRGDVDVWEVVNEEEHAHPFHIHGLFFQPLDVGGVAARTLGWKDTIDVPPRATARLAVPYGELGMWMYHCQIFEHAERGMMGELMVEE
jgi:FtsP/CotA-like multicopper oxidase with cupredoxin domain